MPGYPVANMCFKVYGYISMTQALTFLQDFKLGHYMKIPPRTMFMAQVSLTNLLFPLIFTVQRSDNSTYWYTMKSGNDFCA